jgi:hypothetical protein
MIVICRIVRFRLLSRELSETEGKSSAARRRVGGAALSEKPNVARLSGSLVAAFYTIPKLRARDTKTFPLFLSPLTALSSVVHFSLMKIVFMLWSKR